MLRNFFSKKDSKKEKGEIINKLYNFFKEIISPKYCLSCFNYNSFYLCEKCLIDLNFSVNFSCLECGLRVNKGCPKKNHRTIKFLISFGEYENNFLRNLIIIGKNGIFEIFFDLGSYLGKLLKNYDFSDFYLVPIPVSRKKFLERGFNQAEILAKAINKETRIPLLNILEKTKETKDQVELSYEERLVNLKGAFKIQHDLVPQKIILVDDVKTTGATLKEAAKVFKKAGTKEIIALTILR